MKKLIIVCSSIQTNNQFKFSHGSTRSAFTDEERFRQTLYTLNCLRNIFPEDEIIVVDCSFSNFQYYKEHCDLFNAKYYPFALNHPEQHKIITTHSSVAYCESLMLKTFFKLNKAYLNQFEFIIKTTGRYVYHNLDASIFSEENKNKLFFKNPWKFEWQDYWNFDMVDLRKEQNDNYLYQYSTVLYGLSTSYLNHFIDMFETLNHVIDRPEHSNFDMETSMYFFTRPFQESIIHTDWKLMGWEGAHAKFMCY
jgi:hypothetical protein